MSTARSVLRSSASLSNAAARLAAVPKPMPRPACSPFRISKQNSLSSRIFRSPMELSYCVETMLPHHTATASALLTSMLSVPRRNSGWTLEESRLSAKHNRPTRSVVDVHKPFKRKSPNDAYWQGKTR